VLWDLQRILLHERLGFCLVHARSSCIPFFGSGDFFRSPWVIEQMASQKKGTNGICLYYIVPLLETYQCFILPFFFCRVVNSTNAAR
jgi:hypothetical protein